MIIQLRNIIKKPLLFVGLALILVFVSISGYLVISSVSREKAPHIAVTNIPTTTPIPTINPDQSYTVLLLGYGGAGHSGGSLSDVLMAVRVDPKQKQIALISIPRDLWVPIPVEKDKSVNYKINAAYAIGGDDNKYPQKKDSFKGATGAAELSKHMVSYVTGLPVQSYISVDFEGFKRAIDNIKGVDVEVPATFDDYFYPIKGLENETCGKTPEEIADLSSKYSDFALHKQFTCRYEHIHFDKGTTHMDGETALKFVRSRHSETEGSDFSRSIRQQALLIAIKNQFLSLNAQDDIDSFYNELAKSVKTDLTPAVLREFIRQFGLPKQYSFKMINLNESNVLKTSRSSGGQFILIPKAGEGGWGSVQEYIRGELGK